MVEHPTPPLAGKRVVITRAESQSLALAEALRAKSAIVISLPLIQIAPPQDFAPLDSTLRNLANFDWLIFTSQNAVTAIADRLAVLSLGFFPFSTPSQESVSQKSVIPSEATEGSDLVGRNLSTVVATAANLPRIAAVGNSTAAAVQSTGFTVAYTGKGGTAADLIVELANDLRGNRVFLPRSDRAAAALITQLQDLGAQVKDVIAYRTIPVDSADTSTRESVSRADAILFFSPSAVHAFLNLVKTEALSPLRKNIAIGAVGPVTCLALREAALPCDFQAQEPNVNEIVQALATHFEKAKVSSVSGANSR